MANLKGGTTIGGSLALHLGNYTTYTLPINGGGVINGPLTINPGNVSSYNEGLRIGIANDGWSAVFIGTDGSTSGNNGDGKQWVVGRNTNGEFMIVPSGQEAVPNTNGLTLIKNDVLKWYNNIVLNASNYVTYSSFTTTITTSASANANASLGPIASSWGGTSYPTLYGSTAERWVMHINPHISYVTNGTNGYTGTMTGSTIRMAGQPGATTSWDIGVGTNAMGVDKFSIGRLATNFFSISNDGWVRIAQGMDVSAQLYAYGGLSVGTAGARVGNLAGVNGLAIGDSDTGIIQNGDGNLQIYCNNALVMQYTPSQVTVSVALSAPSFIGNTSWASITGRPTWMTTGSLVDSHIDANSWVNSGFYENGGGGSNWPTQSWYNSINVRHSNQANYHGFHIAMSFYDNLLWFRSYQGSGTFQSWAYAISNQNIGSQSVAAAYKLYGGYISGGGEAPTYFGSDTLKLQMLTSAWGWADTLWMSSYSGGDVKLSNQIVMSKNGPNIGFRQQNYDSTGWGTLYEFITTANIGSQNVSTAGKAQLVDYLLNRTDNADYPVLWGAGQGTNPVTGNNVTYAFSCDAVTINSAYGRVSATNFTAYSTIQLAADGQSSDPYGRISVTRSTGANYNYYGLTRAGQIGWSIGVDTSNRLFFGSGNVDNTPSPSSTFGPDGTIRTNGDVVAYQSSDIRLKDNIKPIENPIEKISKISGNTFDWNDNQDTYTGSDVGVIAQEIEEILPQLVIERESGYKAVKYEKIVPLLIEGIKEQQVMINKQNETILNLENTIKEILDKLK